jgi:hypothetical protein
MYPFLTLWTWGGSIFVIPSSLNLTITAWAYCSKSWGPSIGSPGNFLFVSFFGSEWFWRTSKCSKTYQQYSLGMRNPFILIPRITNKSWAVLCMTYVKRFISENKRSVKESFVTS